MWEYTRTAKCVTVFLWIWIYEYKDGDLGQVWGSSDSPGHPLSVRVDPAHVFPHLLPGVLVDGQPSPVDDERDAPVPQVLLPLVLLLFVPLLDPLQAEGQPRAPRLAQTHADPGPVHQPLGRPAVMDAPAADHRHWQQLDLTRIFSNPPASLHGLLKTHPAARTSPGARLLRKKETGRLFIRRTLRNKHQN